MNLALFSSKIAGTAKLEVTLKDKHSVFGLVVLSFYSQRKKAFHSYMYHINCFNFTRICVKTISSCQIEKIFLVG